MLNKQGIKKFGQHKREKDSIFYLSDTPYYKDHVVTHASTLEPTLRSTRLRSVAAALSETKTVFSQFN